VGGRGGGKRGEMLLFQARHPYSPRATEKGGGGAASPLTLKKEKGKILEGRSPLFSCSASSRRLRGRGGGKKKRGRKMNCVGEKGKGYFLSFPFARGSRAEMREKKKEKEGRGHFSSIPGGLAGE